MNLGLLSFLEKILNQKGLISKGDNVAFYCPVCKKSDLHKKKLIVNLDENSKKFGWWRCWICKDENNMYGRNLVKLLYKLKVDRNKIVELYGLVDKNTLLFIKETDDYLMIYQNQRLILPTYQENIFLSMNPTVLQNINMLRLI